MIAIKGKIAIFEKSNFAFGIMNQRYNWWFASVWFIMHEILFLLQ